MIFLVRIQQLLRTVSYGQVLSDESALYAIAMYFFPTKTKELEWQRQKKRKQTVAIGEWHFVST